MLLADPTGCRGLGEPSMLTPIIAVPPRQAWAGTWGDGGASEAVTPKPPKRERLAAAVRRYAQAFGKIHGALRRVVRTASEFDAAMTRVDEVGMRGCEAGSAFRRVPAGRQALAEKLLQVAAASGHESYIPDEYRKYLPKLTNAECYELERTTPFSFSAIRAEFPRLRERRNQRHGGPIAR